MTNPTQPAGNGGHNDLAALFTESGHGTAFLILLCLLLALIGAFAMFGYASLISVALVSVGLAGAIILLLSRM